MMTETTLQVPKTWADGSPEQRARDWLVRFADRMTQTQRPIRERFGYWVYTHGTDLIEALPVVTNREAARRSRNAFVVGADYGARHGHGVTPPEPPRRRHLHAV